MERIIKFRAWDKENHNMYNVEAILFDDKHTNMIRVGENVLLSFDDIELMQFTGLHDKNGKEIFEGDLISFTEVDEDSCLGREETNTVVVKWIDEIAQYRACFSSGRRTELHFVVKLPTVQDCEVIGNIYENPELIKEVTHV